MSLIKSNSSRLPKKEFVTLMALLTSLVAFAIDSMLPAFQKIAESFQVGDNDDLQLIVAILFLGFGFGQLVFGPISDVLGRKVPIFIGLFIFMLGSVLCGASQSYSWFIIGRFLQGFGGASPRIVSLALVRDEYEGDAMAQITSLVMTIFILVPAIAPTIGQGILFFGSWRQIFIVLFMVAFLVWVWFGLRQPETLDKQKRKSFLLSELISGMKETLSQPTTLCSMLISGCIFGVFVGYLGAVQVIFSDIFNSGPQFPIYFAILALSIGTASLFNSKLVMVYGMRPLLFRSMTSVTLLGFVFVLIFHFGFSGVPPLWLFMIYMASTFFSIGFLFGNLNALAMAPLGHIAGIGSALLGFVQSCVAVGVGVLIGRFFYDDVRPLALAFFVAGAINLALLKVESHFALKPKKI